MRDATRCRANDPRTCWYHGSIIGMEAAMQRIVQTGGKNPADWDDYTKNRLQVEEAEREWERKRWMKDMDIDGAMDGVHEQRPAPQQQQARQPQQPRQATQQQPARQPAQPRQAPPRGQAQPRRQAVAPQPPQPVNRNLFPDQVSFNEADGQMHVYTRADMYPAGYVPNRVMIASSHTFTEGEAEDVMGRLRYQHTMATRFEGRAAKVEESDVNLTHSARSVVLKTQFRTAEQVSHLQNDLTELIEVGSPVRNDGTRKYEPMGYSERSYKLYYA